MIRDIKKLKQEEPPRSEKQGKGVPSNKISDAKMANVWEHTLKFPSYQSNYTRAHNLNRRYPVSYTHLDVYKRTVIIFIKIIIIVFHFRLT